MLKDKKVMLPILLSDILVIISYFIYVFLPESAFANDVSRPGMTAVYIFAAAPVLCLVSAIITAVFFKKIKQAFDAAEKKYVIFQNPEDVSGEVYASCYDESGNLLPIETEEEWEMVEEVLGSFIEETENGNL